MVLQTVAIRWLKPTTHANSTRNTVCTRSGNGIIRCRTGIRAIEIRLHSTQPIAESRVIACSDLYNMAETINVQTGLENPVTTQTELLSSSTTSSAEAADAQAHQKDQLSSCSVQQSDLNNKAAGYNADYYAGLLTTDLRVDNGASGADMLRRSIQLAGGVAGILCLLTYLFLLSNSIV